MIVRGHRLHKLLAAPFGREPARVIARDRKVLALGHLVNTQIEGPTDAHLVPRVFVDPALPVWRAHREAARGDQDEFHPDTIRDVPGRFNGARSRIRSGWNR